MLDADQLPIPDWGVRCPHCDALLGGLRLHRCADCGRPFNMRHLLAMHRPIPDIGLMCAECGYLLTGLVGNRCPECGTEFALRQIFEDQSPTGAVFCAQMADPGDHHVKRREPTLTGHERPLPNLGLSCAECDHALEGATADVCPACRVPFDVFALVPGHQWVDVSGFVPPRAGGIAEAILYAAQVPYLVDNAGVGELYGGKTPLVSGKIRVPRAYFFDALHAFALADEPASAYTEAEWICPACDEHVPAGFEVCWNCSAPHPDAAADEDGQTES